MESTIRQNQNILIAIGLKSQHQFTLLLLSILCGPHTIHLMHFNVINIYKYLQKHLQTIRRELSIL